MRTEAFNKHEQIVLDYCLRRGVDVSWMFNNTFDARQLDQIWYGVQANVDISKYAKKEYNADQMWEIRDGLESKLDVDSFADPSLSAAEMNEIKHRMVKEKIGNTFDDDLFDEGMKQIFGDEYDLSKV